MRKKLVITIVFLSIVIMMVIPTNSVWAGKKSKDKDKDDDDYSDYSYHYKYKFGKDGSFKYKYKFDFGDDVARSESYMTSQNAYNICYRDGQTDRIMPQPFDDTFSFYRFDNQDLRKTCTEGYKDGYYSNDDVLRSGIPQKFPSEDLPEPSQSEQEQWLIELCSKRLFDSNHLPPYCEDPKFPNLQKKLQNEVQKLNQIEVQKFKEREGN